MNKSDLFDELRLEVGMVADKARTRLDFYYGIVNSIGKFLTERAAVAIYHCDDHYFSCIASYGYITEKKREKFGDGMFSICSIRGNLVIKNERYKQRGYVPFYDGQQVIGAFYFENPDCDYEATEEDLIFIKEMMRHIEVKGKRYHKGFQ